MDIDVFRDVVKHVPLSMFMDKFIPRHFLNWNSFKENISQHEWVNMIQSMRDLYDEACMHDCKISKEDFQHCLGVLPFNDVMFLTKRQPHPFMLVVDRWKLQKFFYQTPNVPIKEGLEVIEHGDAKRVLRVFPNDWYIRFFHDRICTEDVSLSLKHVEFFWNHNVRNKFIAHIMKRHYKLDIEVKKLNRFDIELLPVCYYRLLENIDNLQ